MSEVNSATDAPVSKDALESYSHDPSVDMSGYIPLEKRLHESDNKSKPFFIDKKLDGSVPRILQGSRGSVSSEVRQRRRIFHRVKTGTKLALSRGLRLGG